MRGGIVALCAVAWSCACGRGESGVAAAEAAPDPENRNGDRDKRWLSALRLSGFLPCERKMNLSGARVSGMVGNRVIDISKELVREGEFLRRCNHPLLQVPGNQGSDDLSKDRGNGVPDLLEHIRLGSAKHPVVRESL